MFDEILHYAEPVIFGSQGALGILGIFLVVVITRKMSQKRFRNEKSAGEFLQTVREKLQTGDREGIVELCDSPPYWAKAVPQLILVAMAHPELSIGKLRKLLFEKFERDILADLTYQHSGMAVVAKTAPLVGLLGTVTGIIGSFSKISAAQKGDPSALANDIGLALLATMWGLVIAIPMTLLGGYYMVRIGRFSDQAHEHLSEFLQDLESAEGADNDA